LAYGRYMKHLTETAISLQGLGGQLAEHDGVDGTSWGRRFLHAPSLRIAGGSDQVQGTIIGERTLDLPPEPRPDRDVPFRLLAGGHRANGQRGDHE
jgi:alkylation response protein AidB-like acyl-CoA dehydrogenase